MPEGLVNGLSVRFSFFDDIPWLDPWHEVIVLLLLGVAAAQWLILLPAALRSGVFKDIDPDQFPEGYDRDSETLRVLPMAKDVWFILWNLLPFVFLTFYVYAAYRWDEWATDLGLGFVGFGERSIPLLLDGRLWLVVALGGALLGCIGQLNKHRDTSNLYWWDRELRPRIFAVRLVALFFNMFTVVVGVGLVLRLGALLSLAAFAHEVQPRFAHPDGVAGFGSFGQATLAISMTCLVVAGFAVVAWIDHRGQGRLHFAGDVTLLGVAMVLGLWVVLGPPLKVDRQLVERWLPAHEIAMREVAGLRPEHPPDAIVDLIDARTGFLTRPAFPLDVRVFTSLLFSLLTPIAFYGLRRYAGYLAPRLLREELGIEVAPTASGVSSTSSPPAGAGPGHGS